MPLISALITTVAIMGEEIGLRGTITAAVVVYLVARRGVWRPEVTQSAREMIEAR